MAGLTNTLRLGALDQAGAGSLKLYNHSQQHDKRYIRIRLPALIRFFVQAVETHVRRLVPQCDHNFFCH
jgi:hypothetical protein